MFIHLSEWNCERSWSWKFGKLVGILLLLNSRSKIRERVCVCGGGGNSDGQLLCRFFESTYYLKRDSMFLVGIKSI